MVIEYIVAVLFGVLGGGIVNVLADDLPLRRSPRLPRYVPVEKKIATHNPDPDVRATTQIDDEPRPLLGWLGITAFLLGKRVSPSGVQLGWRYPIVEILTTFLVVTTVYVATSRPDLIDEDLVKVGIIQIAFWLIFMVIFSLITIIDIEHKLILFAVIIPSSVIALLDALLTTVLGDSANMIRPGILDAILGGLIGFVFFFLIYNGGFLFTYVMGKVRGQEINEIAFGYGDVMMATLSGFVLGIVPLIVALLVTIILGAIGAAVYIILRSLIGKRYSAFTALPYGPYIVAGTIIVLLYHVPVMQLLLPAAQ